MSLISSIRREEFRFYEATGKKPTRVYLGGDAWFAFAKELQTLGFDTNPGHMPDPSLRFDGMHITLTQGGDRHIGMSYDEKDVW